MRLFRDLKLNNVGLMLNGDVRLFDFGHSTGVSEDQKLPPQNIPFAAPEVVLKAPAGLKSDWWSYGVIAAMLFGQEPFVTSTPEVEERNGYEKPDLGGLDEIKKTFIMKFLKNDPTKRLATPSTDDFFKKLDQTKKFKPPKIEPVERDADEAPEKMTADPQLHFALQK